MITLITGLIELYRFHTHYLASQRIALDPAHNVHLFARSSHRLTNFTVLAHDVLHPHVCETCVVLELCMDRKLKGLMVYLL